MKLHSCPLQWASNILYIWVLRCRKTESWKRTNTLKFVIKHGGLWNLLAAQPGAGCVLGVCWCLIRLGDCGSEHSVSLAGFLQHLWTHQYFLSDCIRTGLTAFILNLDRFWISHNLWFQLDTFCTVSWDEIMNFCYINKPKWIWTELLSQQLLFVW